MLLVDDHDLFRQVLAVVLERHADLDENLQADSVADAYAIVDGHDDLLAWRWSNWTYRTGTFPA